ncbi:hypothetical protein J132_02556 [Termitomyces sp. J132]|nr:hypothetical protein H2248_002463 [Termitomyces sp. 'cryptogamus']KNZ75614.1 hypothetical protein J132_02556 [Termitomyces sp. J132]
MPPARPTTPANSSALIKKNTRCLLGKPVRVKVLESHVANYPELKNKVYTLAENSEVITRSDPTPAVMTGSTEPLSVDNASYGFIGTMDLQVYDRISEEITQRSNLLRHSNLRPLHSNIDVSIPLAQGIIVSVKERVLDLNKKEVARPSELLRITSIRPLSPRTELPITGKSLPLSTASYSAVKVVKRNRKLEVYNPIKVMHNELRKLESPDCD